MAKTINLGKLNAIFNEFLTSDESSFENFLTSNNYATKTDADWDFSDRAAALADTKLNLNQYKPEKYAEYLKFLAKYKRVVLSRDEAIKTNLLAETIATYFLNVKVPLNLSEEDASKVMEELAIGSKKVKTEKSHPKWRWFVKKVLTPVAIGVLIGVAAGLGFGLASVAIGTVPFVSESIGFTLQAYTSLGAILAGIAAPVVINVKDKIVTAHHKRKLNGKETFEMLMENLEDGRELTLEDINNLPAKKFLDEFLSLDAKLIDAKTNSNSKNPILWAKRFGDRNRLHAIYDFEKELTNQIKQGESLLALAKENLADVSAIAEYLYPNKKVRNSVLSDGVSLERLRKMLETAIARKKSLLNCMNDELFGDIVENFISYKSGADKKFRMADIDVTHGKGYKAKAQDLAVIDELVKPIYKKILTTGFVNPETSTGHLVAKNLVELAGKRNELATEKNARKQEKITKRNEAKDRKEEEKLLTTLENIKKDAEDAFTAYDEKPTKENLKAYIKAQTTYISSVQDEERQKTLTKELNDFKNSKIEEDRVDLFEKMENAYREWKNAGRKDKNKDSKRRDALAAAIKYLKVYQLTKSVKEQGQIQLQIDELQKEKEALVKKLAEPKPVKTTETETIITADTHPDLPLFVQKMLAEKKEQERLAAPKAEEDRLAAKKAEEERLAAEQAEKDRLAAEQAEKDRLAAEQTRLLNERATQLEQENAKLKAEQERAAAEQAKKDRKAEEIEKLRQHMLETKTDKIERLQLENFKLRDDRERLEKEVEDAKKAQEGNVSFTTREKTQAEKDLAKAKSDLRKAQAKAGEVIGAEEELKKELNEAADEAQQKSINARINKNAEKRAKVSQEITELKDEIKKLQAIVEQEKATAASTNNSNND